MSTAALELTTEERRFVERSREAFARGFASERTRTRTSRPWLDQARVGRCPLPVVSMDGSWSLARGNVHGVRANPFLLKAEEMGRKAAAAPVRTALQAVAETRATTALICRGSAGVADGSTRLIVLGAVPDQPWPLVGRMVGRPVLTPSVSVPDDCLDFVCDIQVQAGLLETGLLAAASFDGFPTQAEWLRGLAELRQALPQVPDVRLTLFVAPGSAILARSWGTPGYAYCVPTAFLV